MKKNKLILLILIFFLAVVGATQILYTGLIIKDVKILNISMEVAGKAGVNLDNETLAFGTILPGGSLERHVRVRNRYSYPLSVTIQAEGDLMREWLKYPENIRIKPYNETTIGFSVSPPLTAPLGNFSGRVKLILKRSFW